MKIFYDSPRLETIGLQYTFYLMASSPYGNEDEAGELAIEIENGEW